MSFLADIFETDFVINKAGEKKQLADIKNKYVLLYVSASWCPPCRGFTPQLAKFYNDHKDSKDFEIIWYSWDEEEDEYKGYFQHMPWYAFSFSENLEKINGKFEDMGLEIASIPTVYLYENGKLVSKKARGQIPKDPEGNGFPYADGS